MRRTSLLPLVALALSHPAPAAADQLLPQGRILDAGPNSGDILFGALKLGRRQAGKTTLTPDFITGDGSKMTVVPDAAEATGTLAAQLGLRPTLDYAFAGTLSIDSRAFLDAGGSSGGPYTDFDSKSSERQIITNTEAAVLNGAGGMRDAHFLMLRDRDTKNYEASNYRSISNAMRVLTVGKFDAGTATVQWKDLHGAWFTAIGRSGGVARGMSGILAEAVQLGTGVATNEFSAAAPSYANEQAALLAPVIGIIYNYKANADSAHKAYGLQANLYGYASTAAFRAASVPAAGQPGAAQYGLKMDELTVSGPAITMPQPLTGTTIGTIDYGNGASTSYDSAANAFVFKLSSAEVARIDSGSLTSAGNLRGAMLAVGGAPRTGTNAKANLYGDVLLEGANATLMGNIYFGGSWKYTQNGSAGYITFAPNANTAFQIGYAGNNTAGANSVAVPQIAFQVTSDGLIVHSRPYTPPSATASCATGTQAWDASYVYVCVATNTWKRSALATW